MKYMIMHMRFYPTGGPYEGFKPYGRAFITTPSTIFGKIYLTCRGYAQHPNFAHWWHKPSKNQKLFEIEQERDDLIKWWDSFLYGDPY